MHKRVEAHVHARCPSVATVDDHMCLTGHGDGDEVEYDDKDKEPCPQRLHNPTHVQSEGGDMFV